MYAELQGTHILGYRLEELIGEGGMGAVWKAEHPTLGTSVAIKLLDPLLARDPELVERFIDEAKIQSQLRHHGIVQLENFSTDPLAIILELVPGRALDDVIGREVGPIPFTRALPMMKSIIDTVGYAHRMGVLHRDIKPSNVLVTPDGHVKVMDFGVAKVLGQAGRTRTGASVGTPEYMAPEQVRGERDIDERADIYALGVTFYEMLAGRTPFEREALASGDFEIMDAQVRLEPPDPRDFYPAIPETVVGVVLTALSKEPAERYQSCDELKTALEVAADVELEAEYPDAGLAFDGASTVAGMSAELVEELTADYEEETARVPQQKRSQPSSSDTAWGGPPRSAEPGLSRDGREPGAGTNLIVRPAEMDGVPLFSNESPVVRTQTPEPRPTSTLSENVRRRGSNLPLIIAAIVGVSVVVTVLIGLLVMTGQLGARNGGATVLDEPPAPVLSAAEPVLVKTPPPVSPTAPVPPPSTPPPPAKARITVKTYPEGARVLLDGNQLGRAPITAEVVPEVVHAISAQEMDYRARSEFLSLSPGEHRELILSLESSLPSTLTEDQIRDGFRPVSTKVRRCLLKALPEFAVTVRGRIMPDGHIVSVSAPYSKSAWGNTAGFQSCMKGAVSSATWPRFKGEPIDVSKRYPGYSKNGTESCLERRRCPSGKAGDRCIKQCMKSTYPRF